MANTIPDPNNPVVKKNIERLNNPSIPGPFCNLATGVNSAIQESIFSTINALNSVQDSVENLLYAPSRGLTELQNRILSGEILNDLTKEIAFNLSKLISNSVKTVATNVAVSFASSQAGKVLKSAQTAVGNIADNGNKVANAITNVANQGSRTIQAVNKSIAAGVGRLAALPAGAIENVGNSLGGAIGTVSESIGRGISKASASIAADVANSIQYVGKSFSSTVTGPALNATAAVKSASEASKTAFTAAAGAAAGKIVEP